MKKRDHRDSCGVGTTAVYGGSKGNNNTTTTNSVSVGKGTECSSYCVKSKLWEEEHKAGADAGMDELLAVLEAER